MTKNDRPDSFRGRNIHITDKYPAVSWPGHPMSMGAGTTYIHRIVAYEKYDEIPNGYHVHHVDGDVWNWDPSNLVLMEESEHMSHHQTVDKIVLVCDNCDGKFKVLPSESSDRKYCSFRCSQTDQGGVYDWPVENELRELVWEKPLSCIAEDIGCSLSAVRKKCDKWNIDTPPQGYWLKSDNRRAEASGSSDPNRKLADDQVLEIKDRLEEGESSVSISQEFPVSPRTVRGIRRGEVYKDVCSPVS